MKFIARAGVWIVPVDAVEPCAHCGGRSTILVAENDQAAPQGPWCDLRCWADHHDLAAEISGSRAQVQSEGPPPPWRKAARRFPFKGPVGLSDARDRGSDVIAYRDITGTLRGILWHRAGRLRVLVQPTARRQGIGAALVRAAGRRWPIDLDAQIVTRAGAALTEAALPEHAGRDRSWTAGVRAMARTASTDRGGGDRPWPR